MRTTTDVDLVVLANRDQFLWLDAALRARGAIAGKATGPADSADELPDIVAYWHSSNTGAPAVRIDVFIAKTQFERAVLAAPRRRQVLGAEVPLASPEASIIYKLLANRSKDVDDVASIFISREAARDPLDWTFLDHWATEWGIEERLAPYRVRYGGR